MGRIRSGVKVVIALVYLIIPITVTSTEIIDPPQSADPSQLNYSSSSFSLKGIKCTELVKAEMIAEVIKHLNVTENLKHTLNTSAEFGVCVANHLCNCMALPYPPVIYACLGGLGFKCMKDALHLTPHLLACALACPNSPIVDTNSTTIIGSNNTTTITGSGSNTTAIIGTNTTLINTNSTGLDSNSTLKHDHEALKDFCNNNCKKKD